MVFNNLVVGSHALHSVAEAHVIQNCDLYLALYNIVQSHANVSMYFSFSHFHYSISIFIWLVPAQDFPYALILWYEVRIIYLY